MLQTLLAEGRPLLADGATGTNLFAMGLASGEPPELWNETHPDRLLALHQAFVEAGSDIILTDSFGGNRRRLALHGLAARARELNMHAARNARAVADRAPRRVVVAGSVGPTGDILAPLGSLSEDESIEIFVEQIEGLRDGGADVVWIETMSAAEEIRAAARAAAAVGIPYTVTASFDTAGRTMMGVGPAALGALVADFDPKPAAYGANCGVGAADLLVAILAMSAADPGAALIAKANAGVPRWRGAEIHYSGTPELMASYAGLAVDCGARIIGGCCGNEPSHVAAMRRALDAHRAGPRPTVEAIVAALGPLAAPAPRKRRSQPAPRAGLSASAKRWPLDRGAAPEPRAPRAPLVPPSGPQIFDVGAAGAGERLDRFLGQAAIERRVALSRTRLKALIEAGEVTVDGAIARDPAMRLARGRQDRLRGAAAGGVPAPRRGPAARRRLRGRASHRHRQAGRAWSSIRRRATPAARWSTRSSAIADRAFRASAGSGGRASSTGSTRTPPASSSSPRPTPPIAGSPSSSPTTAAAVARARISRARLGRLRRGRRQGRRGDRPPSASSRENGGRARGARPPRRHPLAARGGAGPREPRRLPARNRANPSDPRPHGLDRPSAARRFGLRRAASRPRRRNFPREQKSRLPR